MIDQRTDDQDFVPWDGNYEKQWYDVKTPEGAVVKGCWPNAGCMVATDGTGWKWFPKDNVQVRVGLCPFLR